MSERSKIIKNFCNRFLSIQIVPDSFSDILDLPPSNLKDCSIEDMEKLQKQYKKIRDLSKIDFDDIEKIAIKIGIDELKLKNWVLASNLLKRAWQKRSNYLKKSEIKIAVLGLDNAGKTTMLETLSGASGLGDVQDLEPTIGVDVRKIASERMNVVLWDFGGQVDHRHDYLKSPEEYFLQLDLVIYVIDMQNPERYEESLEYFKQIFNVINFLKEHPYVLILLHKADPDYVKDPDYEINREYLQDEIKKILEKNEINYEILPSSIYNYYTTEPEFAQTLKKYFGKNKSQNSVENSINVLSEMIAQYSNSILEELKVIKSYLTKTNLTPPNIESQQVSNKISLVNLPPPPPSSNLKNTTNDRNALMAELREVFNLRKITERNN